MTQPTRFDEALETVGQLSPEQQETLLAIIQRRLAERGRQRVVGDVQESRREFQEGRCQPVTTDDLMQEILS